MHSLIFVIVTVLYGQTNSASLWGIENSLIYDAKFESNVFDKEHINSQIRFALEPMRLANSTNVIRKLILLSVSHDFKSKNDTIHMPIEVLNGTFIIEFSREGLVLRVYHSETDLHSILVTKKYVTSALSGHLNDENAGDEWEYVLHENDHNGPAHHFYQAKRDTNGIVYTRQKTLNPDVPHGQRKVMHVNNDGVLASVIGHEHTILFKDHNADAQSETERSRSYEEEPLTIESKVDLKLIEARSMSVTELSWQTLIGLNNDTLEVHQEENVKTYTSQQISEHLNKGLKCAREQQGSLRSKCVVEMRQVVESMTPGQVKTLGSQFLQNTCENNEALPSCRVDRDLLLDLFARKDCAESQRLVLQQALTTGNSEEIRRVLFHFSAIQNPTQESIETIASLCFGMERQHIGSMKMEGNQKRACMSLGAMLGRFRETNNPLTEELLSHFHDWLRAHHETDEEKLALTPLSLSNKTQNARIHNVLAVKSIILHALGNAGHTLSKRHIMEQAKANRGHPEVRRSAIKSLRKFSCEESATVLLNATLHDGDHGVRNLALETYNSHPRAYLWSHTDQNIILSKDSRLEPLFRSRRSSKCNWIEKLTFDKRIDLPGFEWSKDVGNDAIGAQFGVKVVNYVHLHLSPVAMFAKVNLDNRAWIQAHVKILRRQEFKIFNAEACYVQEFRLYDISGMLDYNIKEIMAQYEMFENVYSLVIMPLKESLSEMYGALGLFSGEFGLADLTIGKTILKDMLLESPYREWLEDKKEVIVAVLNATFEDVHEFVNEVQQLKADVIHRKDEIVNKVRDRIETAVERVQTVYEGSIQTVSDAINEYLESVDVDFQLEILDECLGTVQIIDVIRDPENAGEDIVECLKSNLQEKLEDNFGLMSKVNQLVKRVRELQEKYQEIKQKVEGIKQKLENMKSMGWQEWVELLLRRMSSYLEENSSGQLDHLNSIMDDLLMSIQYCVQAIDKASTFIENALALVKESPLGALKNIDRGVLRMRIAMTMMDRVQGKISQMGLEVQGKLQSWIEAGQDHANLIQGLSMVISKLQRQVDQRSGNLLADNSVNARLISSPRDRLSEALKENAALQSITSDLQSLVDGFRHVQYLSDNYTMSLQDVRDAMDATTNAFENLQRATDNARTYVLQIFGIKFHPSFPNRLKVECEDRCGGCGIYPNIFYGRKGIQLYAEEGLQLLAPLDSRVMPISGSTTEILLYPQSSEMRDYEVVIKNVKPIQQVLDSKNGLFVDAGAYIGDVTKSECSPNFIHVSVRKVNSSMPATRSAKGPFGLLSSHHETSKLDTRDESCGAEDDGDYITVDQMYEKPEPNPKYIHSCDTIEFKHIFEYFDLEKLAEILEHFEEHWEKIVDNLGDIDENEMEDIMYDDATDWYTVDQVADDLDDEANEFAYDTLDQVSRGLVDIQYVEDENGNRVREIAYNLPRDVPLITNYFSTMNMTANELIQFLSRLNLESLGDSIKQIAGELAVAIDEDVCSVISKARDVKRRLELGKETGNRLMDMAQDKIQAELETLKYRSCSKLFEAISKSEHHYCQIPESQQCNAVVCTSRLEFDNFVLEATFALQVDTCSLSVNVRIGNENVTITLTDQGVEAEASREITFQVGDHVTVKLKLHVKFTVERKLVINISFSGCHDKLPECYDKIPVITNLTYDLASKSEKCLDFSVLQLPCMNNNSTAAGQSKKINRSSMDRVLDLDMPDYMYLLDKFDIAKETISSILNDVRMGMLTKLQSLTELKSSVTTSELISLPDLKSEDKISKGPWDIPFFKIVFAIPPIVITVEAGGSIRFGFDFFIEVLQGKLQAVPKPSIAGYALADGRATIVVASVGLEMRGTLLETIFNIILDILWPQFPVINRKTVRVDLIPIGVEFAGYMKVLKVPIKIPIFKWQADKIYGTPSFDEELIHDPTPPTYEWSSGSCIVEQLPGRHWSDPALKIEAPFYDAQSILHIEYAIGTYQDGTDVLSWSPMEGASQTIVGPLKTTGVALFVTVRATNTDNQETTVRCVLDTYDITPPSGRMEPSYLVTSHPSKLRASLIVIEDSQLVEEQYVGVGMGESFYGDSEVNWHLFDLEKEPANIEGEGVMAKFAGARPGKLTAQPLKHLKTKFDHECADECVATGDGCVSFDYDYISEACDIHWTVEGMHAELAVKDAYHNFEKLGSGHSAFFSFDGLPLRHGQSYYINAHITNVLGYEGYLVGHEVVVDFSPPSPGPIGDAQLDDMRHDGCSAAITQAERCQEVTPNDNHRHIIDGPGAKTVFNGNYPQSDMKYTINNHYITANWDGFHDNETDIWGYTWAAGTTICGTEIQDWDDPHAHLADKSYWTHQGAATDLHLADGPYYVSVQALNSIVYGGALVTSVCHSNFLIVDTSPPMLHFVDNIFYDEDFDLMGIYYEASDPDSGILHTDIGLGETKHDVYIRGYSRHRPLHDGYEMVSVDGVDLPHGVPVWVRVRVVNNVEMLEAGHAADPIMIDTTSTVLGSVLDGEKHLFDLDYQPHDNRLCVQWYDWYDPESGIDRFLWGIGTVPNETNVMKFVTYDHWVKSACVDITLNHTETYYNTIAAYNKALNSRRSQATSDGIMVDVTEPVAGWVHDGADSSVDVDFSAHAASFASHWGDFYDKESGLEEYKITLSVNGQQREVFHKKPHEQYLDDHTQHFQHGDFVEVEVEATNQATLKNETKSTGYRVDLTAPRIHYIRDHPANLIYQTSDSELYAAWHFDDLESGITQYKYRVFEHRGGASYQKWPTNTTFTILDTSEEKFETTIENMDLSNGIKYSLEVIAVNGAGTGSRQTSQGVTVDVTPPIVSKLFIGTFGADEALNDDGEVIHDDQYGVHANWVAYDHESGLIIYMLGVGTGNGDYNSVSHGWRDFGQETNGYIDGIQLNVTAETGVLYYVTIFAINGAGTQSEYLASRPIHVYGENVAGMVYDGRDLFNDMDYSQDTQAAAMSFQGFDSPACGIRAYEWCMGSQPGYSDILPYTSYGIVMVNDSHGFAEIHIPLKHGDVVYASVRAHTGHRCSEAMLVSSSNGYVVDTKPPVITFTELGLFSNDSEEMLNQHESIYQTKGDAIYLSWNSTDDFSGTGNDTWMAGSLPLHDDRHVATITDENQIPMLSVIMSHGETVIFTVVSRDHAGNIATASPPPLTVDITPPIIKDFQCNGHLSSVATELICTWTTTYDDESKLVNTRLGIGTGQLIDDLFSFEDIPYGQNVWRRTLDEIINLFDNGTSVIVTIKISNWVGLESVSFQSVVIDATGPTAGEMNITTPTSPDEETTLKICQQSKTTMQLTWTSFMDDESPIETYEVGIGSAAGLTDLEPYRSVGLVNHIFLTQLNLTAGTQVFAVLRAINKARLSSPLVSAGVYISPTTTMKVWDGSNKIRDIDYQNDLSSLSGQVFMDYPCPVQYAEWRAFDLHDNPITNTTPFYNLHFTNDELHLTNFYTYYVIVDVVDMINRTWKGRSNGVMTYIQPPETGAVRDGPYVGEDRAYQESTHVLSFNWDKFGNNDDPLQQIVRYEVAIGDNPAYDTTRTNIQYFTDAGQNTTFTFYHLDLVAKTKEYYGTVRAYAASGAYIDGVSNGIRVGYQEGMIPGELQVPQYIANTTYISLYWDGFYSDFSIRHYFWAIGLLPFVNDNVTLPCTELKPMFDSWATVHASVDEGANTFGEYDKLNLEHGLLYFITVMAEDEAGQCTTAQTKTFRVDVTPPTLGRLEVEGLSGQVQYSTSESEMSLSFEGFLDAESDISESLVQLFEEPTCEHDSPQEKWLPISDIINLKDGSKYTFRNLNLTVDVVYRVHITVTNGAGITVTSWSEPIFVDVSSPDIGTVRDGADWYKIQYFQSVTTELRGVVVVSPAPFDCPFTETLIPVADNSSQWVVLDDVIIEQDDPNMSDNWRGIYVNYQDRNVNASKGSAVEIDLHYNISTLNLEGGFLMSANKTTLEGTYSMRVKGPSGDRTIFSITLSEGFMDEFMAFDLPIVEDVLTDDEFESVAEDTDLEFDNGLPGTENPMTTQTTTQEILTTPEKDENYTEPFFDYSDGLNTYGFGIHILGFPLGNKTKEWKVLAWLRDPTAVRQNWATLKQPPSTVISDIEIDVIKDTTDDEALWNVIFKYDGTLISHFEGVPLPDNFTIKARHWTYEQYVPPLTDPFNPFHTSSKIYALSVPIPKEKPCHFGNAFTDIESSVQQIYVGVSNSTDYEDNIMQYQLVYDLCHACKQPCDFYKCTPSCNHPTEDGYYLLPIYVSNLTLDPGYYKESTILGTNEDLVDTAYMSNRYYILVKAINSAGLISKAVSTGIEIDLTPPVVYMIISSDAQYDPYFPATHQGHNTSLSAWWDIKDIESDIEEYQVAVGLSPNASDVIYFFSVGKKTEIIIEHLENIIEFGNTYYITVIATNYAGLKAYVSTDGITVFDEFPVVRNTSSVPQDAMEWIGNHSAVWFSENQETFGITLSAILDNTTFIIEWGTGTDETHNDITMKQEIDSRLFDQSPLELRGDGYFRFGNQRSNNTLTFLSQMQAQINMTLEGEYIDPGYIYLEPGRCVHHHVSALNIAHRSTLIEAPVVCIKHEFDEVLETYGHFSIHLFHQDVEVIVTGNGVSGVLHSGVLAEADLTSVYWNSANITYRPYIVNPHLTGELNMSRSLRGRGAQYTDKSWFLVGSPKSTISRHLNITMLYYPINFDIWNETVTLCFWNPYELKWYDISESCGSATQIDLDKKLITAQFCGYALDGRLKSFKYWDVPNTEMSLFILSSDYSNTAPEMLVHNVTTYMSVSVEEQLSYFDAEDDMVTFSLSRSPLYGNATVSRDGLLFYKPDPYFSGIDELVITITEKITVSGVTPHSVESVMPIYVLSVPTPPVLVLQLDSYQGGMAALSEDAKVLKFEGNTTEKQIGEFYLCDLSNDQLSLVYQNWDSERVSVIVDETPDVVSNEATVDLGPHVQECFNRNYKTYSVRLVTGKDYHGNVTIKFIGRDESPYSSNMITIDVYTMVSPCGTHGYCYSSHDPTCTSVERASSFSEYDCQCDTFYTGSFCQMTDALKISLTVIGTCWIGVILLVAFVRYRNSRGALVNNKVHPIDDSGIELDHIESEELDEEVKDEIVEPYVATFVEPKLVAPDDDIGEVQATSAVTVNGKSKKRYKSFASESKQRWLTSLAGNTIAPEEITPGEKPSSAMSRKSNSAVRRNHISPRP